MCSYFFEQELQLCTAHNLQIMGPARWSMVLEEPMPGFGGGRSFVHGASPSSERKERGAKNVAREKKTHSRHLMARGR